VLRGHAGEPEHVLIVSTLGAPQRRLLRGRRARPASAQPAPVTTTRVTLVAARPFPDAAIARAWLRDTTSRREDADAQADAAIGALNGVLYHQRVASADPFLREIARAQALVVRVGIGEGEQMADGRWSEAVELPGPRERPRREAALRSQERLAALLGGRDAALACEELALRARADVDAGRRREAALQLEAALGAALDELAPWSGQAGLAARLDELRDLRAGVAAAAQAAREGAVDDDAAEHVAHALGRLEAALRARTALGFD
jgi:hypothetical protein